MDNDYRLLEAEDVTIEQSLDSDGGLMVSVGYEDSHGEEVFCDYYLTAEDFLEYCEHIKALYKQAKRDRRARQKQTG